MPTESFFNFFSPPQPPKEEDDEDEEIDEDIEDRLELDYQLGEDIKEKLIPRAIDWFTGEALAFEELDDDDELESGGFDDDDDEDDLSDDHDDEEEETDEEVSTFSRCEILITVEKTWLTNNFRTVLASRNKRLPSASRVKGNIDLEKRIPRWCNSKCAQGKLGEQATYRCY